MFTNRRAKRLARKEVESLIVGWINTYDNSDDVDYGGFANDVCARLSATEIDNLVSKQVKKKIKRAK